jgi:uncharacterized protein YoaH (UPF0181 family)
MHEKQASAVARINRFIAVSLAREITMEINDDHTV